MTTNDRKLKILFLPSNGWYPSKKKPTAGLPVKEHIKAAAIYNDVKIIYSDRADKKTKKLYEIYSDKMEDGIHTIRIKHREYLIPNLIYRWSILSAFKKLLNEGWKPDVIHVHVFLAGVVATNIGKKFGIPVVITERWSDVLRHKLNKKDVQRARYSMDRASIILPVSMTLKEAIISYGIENQYEVVPNIVDTSLFHRNPNQRIFGKKMILCIGALTPKKGVNYLLDALAYLKTKRDDFILDIIGDGPNRKEYEKLTRKLKLEETVIFHGTKPKHIAADFMRDCTFYMQHSMYETFGVTYIEAMACGKPIVATNIPALQEKIDKSKGILIPPKDVGALTNAIDYMLDHYQDYSPMEISGYAQDNFSREKVGKQLDWVYRRIIGS